MFPRSLLQSAATEGSDHCPLLLGLSALGLGKRRFHFEMYWPKVEGFADVVAAAWSSIQATNCPLETLSLKFRALTRELQSWSQKRVGYVKSQLLLAKELVHQLEIAQDSRPLSAEENDLRCMLKKHSLALSSLLRTMARSRSRIDWLKDGDANTTLFHLQARHRKRKNFIPKLVVGDSILTSQEEKEQAAYDFYHNLLGTAEQREFTIDLEQLGVPVHDLQSLDEFFTEDEVWATIKSMPSDKAPGPNGFTDRFYKTYWQIIKSDIMAALIAI